MRDAKIEKLKGALDKIIESSLRELSSSLLKGEEVKGMDKSIRSEQRVVGRLTYVLIGKDGKVKAKSTIENVQTHKGDEYDAKCVALQSVDAMDFIALGLSSTAAAKTDTWLLDPYTNNYKSIESGYPEIQTSTRDGTSYSTVVVYKFSLKPATDATVDATSGISEAVLTHTSPNADGTAKTGQTIKARAVLSPTVNLGSEDTLVITWKFDYAGQV